ncbi:MAG TPA: DNA-formamidopyrimidine glycosylase family protein [Polyangiales bacterium]|nr:DNA-formamidopyrimidine glycosylase family protein [Polyangiales bacterium]
MPELPDVEGFKRYLSETSLHKKIENVHVGSAKILRGISSRRLKQALRGRSMESTRRRGKHLFVALDDGRWLTLHFGMTGRLAYFKSLDDDPEHDRLRLDFERGAGSEDLVNRLPKTYLLSHREEGRSCPRCKGTIETIKTAGRTTYYCPRCQTKTQ